MKVFVSSTHQDLVDHRQAVDQILGRLAVQFRGMELFGSRPAEPKAVCFDEIASCDIFVGIYAHRYGWIPDGEIFSITEQEFDEARRLHKPCYCYVVDPDHPWNPKNIEIPMLDKIKHFHAKVGTLVRSRFTTPDNLAKQIAADLVSAFTERHPTRGIDDLVGFLRTCAIHEISTTIGTKYIRDLYVGRALDRSLQLQLEQTSRTTTALAQLCSAVTSFASSLEFLIGRGRRPNSDALLRFRETLEKIRGSLAGYVRLPSTERRLNYPAQELTEEVSQLRRLVMEVEEGTKPHESTAEMRAFSSAMQTVTTSTAEVLQVLKPVYLIVDRAGGGKTNLLCHLAEVFAQSIPIFFIAAKSVPEASEAGISRYLASVYPISSTPIEDAVATIGASELHCIVIIDGINEHFDPLSFNNALKAIIRRYYHQPVKFLLSCRDIYWRYFEDEWWISHGAFVSRDALYAFTRVEYKGALPLYLNAFDIEVAPTDDAKRALHHPLLLRFFCEAYKGSPATPTRIGTLAELRLLELFDAYCARKFEQIRARLGLLDSEEIFEFLKMVALMMVDSGKRLLSTTAVAQKARSDFGERSIRTIGSRYVQILDEDILIEERPLGDLSHTVVGFVYDEFMEYMIARSLWSTVVLPNTDPVDSVLSETKKLMRIQSTFISVRGIVLYLGELLAGLSEHHLLRYLDGLAQHRKTDLVCDIAVRISATRPRASVFQRVLDLHRKGRRAARHQAWNAIQQMAPAHWRLVQEYLASASEGSLIDGHKGFILLRKLIPHLNSSELNQALDLVKTAITSRTTRINVTSELDFKTGINTAKSIAAHAKAAWDDSRNSAATAWIEGVRKDGWRPRK